MRLETAVTCGVGEDITELGQVVFWWNGLQPVKDGEGMVGQARLGKVLQQGCTGPGVQAVQPLGHCRDRGHARWQSLHNDDQVLH